MFLRKYFKNISKLLIVILVVVLIFNCNHLIYKKEFQFDQIRNDDVEENIYNVTPNIQLFDLSKNLEPIKMYDEITGKNSLNYIVKTLLCIHDTRHDVHISGSIWRSGILEPFVFKPFIDFVKSRPDSLVIDIGANIGIILF